MRYCTRTALIALSFFLGFQGASAQVNTGGSSAGGVNTGGSSEEECTGLCNPLLNIDTFPEFLGAILDGIIEIGTIVLVMMLVFVGFKFVVARGNPEEISSARNALLWTVIGGLILLGAKAIQLVITGTVESIMG
jgi:hypothetical protein